MKSYWLIVQLCFYFVIVCKIIDAQPRIATANQNFSICRFGGAPISRIMNSLWLAGADRHPRLMVFFSGTDDWHKTLWTINSKFEKGKPGWAELQSEKATLRVEINPETTEATIQSRKFNINESNTFLVLNAGDPLILQRIIALGVFDLPRSDGKPSSLLLLQVHPELIGRINKEVRVSEYGHRGGSLARPCTGKLMNWFNKNPSRNNESPLFLTMGFTQGKSRNHDRAPCADSVLDDL